MKYSYLAAFSDEEVKLIAQLKRIFECVEGDTVVQEAVMSKVITPEAEERLKSIGVDIDMKEISFLWEIPAEYVFYVTAITYKQEEMITAEISEKIKAYPLMELWGRYVKEAMSFTKRCTLNQSKEFTENSLVNGWRKRRIASAKSELGHFGNCIDHPLYAFELSAGCSVGCWFCSFATDKLKAVLDYKTNKDYFAAIINKCVEMFGKEGAGWALPYYRTEPHDNPNYIDYLKDFEAITGSVLCTSTAVGQDVKWISDLLEYYDQGAHSWPRISVLSKGMLKTVHDNFTPDQLLSRQLLMQMKEHSRPKVTGGRILEEQSGLRDIEPEKDIRQTMVPQGSIACASGFLINLVRRTVDVFSPCYTSAKWPYGYRVFDSAAYTDENDFVQVVTELINRNMFMSPPADKILRFRDDIVYKDTAAGFDLVTPNQIHHFKMKDKCGPVGALIAEGNMTCAEVQSALVSKHGIHPLVVKASVQKLFDDGLIDEVYNTAKSCAGS